MSIDIALVWNPAIMRADVQLANGTLLTDAGLQTMVTVMLLSDRLAEPGDVLPDNGGPRGWWADGYNGTRLGSRLWLLKRAVLTQATLNLAQDYALEALQPLLDANIAGSLSVKATQIGLNAMNLAVTIVQAGASKIYNIVWSAQAQQGQAA
jgi:phage gp46-like protein